MGSYVNRDVADMFGSHILTEVDLEASPLVWSGLDSVPDDAGIWTNELSDSGTANAASNSGVPA